MIFYTLFYTLEEMDNENEIVKVNIDEDNKIGTAIIRDIKNNTLNDWYWDNDLDIWIRKVNK